MLPILESLKGSNTERGSISYFQQKFQPESAPNVSIVKMGVLNSSDIQESFMHMIVQEAFMNTSLNTSDRKNLRNNTEKSKLPGLEGSTYFIKDGQNIFFTSTGELNQSLELVNNKFQINKDNPLLNELVNTIIANLDSSLDEFVELVVSEKATLDGFQLADMYDKIKNCILKITNLMLKILLY